MSDEHAMKIEFTVPAPPPRRTHPGRSADRSSPNASALFEVAAKIVAETPERFPETGSTRLILRAAAVPLPEYPDYYSTHDAVLEVLVDAGMLADQRQNERELTELDSTITTGYSVELQFMS